MSQQQSDKAQKIAELKAQFIQSAKLIPAPPGYAGPFLQMGSYNLQPAMGGYRVRRDDGGRCPKFTKTRVASTYNDQVVEAIASELAEFELL